MIDLYPLLMSPAFDPRPWGTFDLSPIYPNHRFTEKIGEAWLTGDEGKIANGPLRGQTLSAITSKYGRDLVGEAAPDPNRFPLLTKFLFPHEKLSVQVHPDDEAARRVGQPWGKTECWYVAHAKPGARVALGLKPGVTQARFAEAIEKQHAEELLNWIDIFAGEMIYVAGGTVHTLGPGSTIVETQQQSDTTYRLYDYGRPRELHLKDGLAAVKEQVASGKVIAGNPVSIGGNRQRCLIVSPYFVVEKFELKTPLDFRARDNPGKSSVQILVAIDGCGVVEASAHEPVALAKGDAVVLPACFAEFSVRPQWEIQFLRAFVPGQPQLEPATRM